MFQSNIRSKSFCTFYRVFPLSFPFLSLFPFSCLCNCLRLPHVCLPCEFVVVFMSVSTLVLPPPPHCFCLSSSCLLPSPCVSYSLVTVYTRVFQSVFAVFASVLLGLVFVQCWFQTYVLSLLCIMCLFLILDSSLLFPFLGCLYSCQSYLELFCLACLVYLCLTLTYSCLSLFCFLLFLVVFYFVLLFS